MSEFERVARDVSAAGYNPDVMWVPAIKEAIENGYNELLTSHSADMIAVLEGLPVMTINIPPVQGLKVVTLASIDAEIARIKGGKDNER